MASSCRRIAIAASRNPCGFGRVQGRVAELVELGSKCGLDLLGVRRGELVLERENSLRPDRQSVGVGKLLELADQLFAQSRGMIRS